jgi:hypothetical protein
MMSEFATEQQLADAHRNLMAANARAKAEALRQIPVTEDWFEGVRAEAEHQRLRYPPEHDASKNPLDWFWLIGYLAQKAAFAALAGDDEKAKHHTISTSAALLNWHRQITENAPPQTKIPAKPSGARGEE